MTATVKASIITGVFAITSITLGWGLNWLTGQRTVDQIIIKYEKGIAAQRVLTELVRFQTLSQTIASTAQAVQSTRDKTIYGTRAELEQSLLETTAILNQFPFVEWIRFSRSHIKPGALTGMNEASEKRAKLPLEIQRLIGTLPEPVTTVIMSEGHQRILTETVAKFNELHEAQARFSGIIESLTEKDLSIPSD